MNVPFSFTKDEYYKTFGLTPDSNDGEEVKTKITQICRFVWMYICTNSSINWRNKADSLSKYQIETLKDAAMEQMMYEEKNNGSTAYSSGFDPFSNSVVDANDLHGRDIAPTARDLLSSGGFLYKGVR